MEFSMEWIAIVSSIRKNHLKSCMEHGGFLKDKTGLVLNKSHVICCYCGKKLKYKDSPSKYLVLLY